MVSNRFKKKLSGSNYAGLKKLYKKGKRVYVKSKPLRRKIGKNARRISGNIDDYFAQDRKSMRDIASGRGWF